MLQPDIWRLAAGYEMRLCSIERTWLVLHLRFTNLNRVECEALLAFCMAFRWLACLPFLMMLPVG